MFYMNEKVATQNANKNKKTFIKKEKTGMPKGVTVETAKLTATDLSDEEWAAIIDSEVNELKEDNHAKVTLQKEIRDNKIEIKYNRKIMLEAQSENHLKKMKAPKAEVKEGLVVIDNCKVVDSLPGAKFKVQVGPNVVLCYLNGKLRQNKINITVGDIVRVELSTYDMTNGRITWRF